MKGKILMDWVVNVSLHWTLIPFNELLHVV